MTYRVRTAVVFVVYSIEQKRVCKLLEMAEIRHIGHISKKFKLSKLVLKNCVSFGNNNVRYFSSNEKLVDVAVNDKTGVSVVTMQRRPVNGLNLDLLAALSNTFDLLEKDNCKGMILTSSLPTVFCAGLDLNELYKPNEERFRSFWTLFQDVWIKLFSSTFPTAAAINGHAPAGGCVLALSCEYRIMVGPKFTIGLNETQVGIIAPRWVRDTIKNTISTRNTELALTMGTMFSADEALKIGLIDETATDKAEAITKSEKFLSKCTNIPVGARRLTKMTLRQSVVDRLDNNREADFQSFFTPLQQKHVQDVLEHYMGSLKQKAQ